MLLTGNYRCITLGEPRPIREAVHADLEKSRAIYAHVDAIARRLGADPADQVPFEKYARAAESLLKPASAARGVAAGAPADRKSVVWGKRVAVRVDLDGCRPLKKKNKKN